MRLGFIIVALLVLFSFNGYVFLRGWQALPSTALRPIYLGSMIFLFLSMLVSMIFGSSMPALLGKGISFVGNSYFIIFTYLLLSFLLVDVVRIANYFFEFSSTGLAGFRLWTLVGTLGLTAIAMGIGNWNFNHPKVVTLNITVDKPLQNKELKIVAASDIHLGISIDKKRLQSYVDLINAQHPDIVLFAGDVSDRSMIPVVNQKMVEELRQIHAPLGVYAINGNHEHYAETPNATAEYLKMSGINVLRDEVSLVDSSFYVVGRDDRSNPKRKNLNELVKELNSIKPVILLDHQPYHLEEAEQNGIDLQISGHTHNGQFFPGNLLVKHMYEVGYGYLKKGKTNFYISSGLGLWGPQYRIGTQSELVVINLKY